jgi:hypothetical protein
MYSWQGPYEASILETDPSRLSRLIAIAQAAIDARLAELRSARPADAQEIYVIDIALAGLENMRKSIRVRKAG